jgi:hypothetical protein
MFVTDNNNDVGLLACMLCGPVGVGITCAVGRYQCFEETYHLNLQG